LNTIAWWSLNRNGTTKWCMNSLIIVIMTQFLSNGDFLSRSCIGKLLLYRKVTFLNGFVIWLIAHPFVVLLVISLLEFVFMVVDKYLLSYKIFYHLIIWHTHSLEGLNTSTGRSLKESNKCIRVSITFFYCILRSAKD
jgi:hypothetical protein